MRWLALVGVAASCASSRWVVVRVTTPDGAPLAGATVSAVCPPIGSGAKLTGDDGAATLEVRAGERCVVTATREDHLTMQTRIVACAARASCAAVELRLERE